MKYTVLWSEPAERQLAEIWLATDDQNGVTSAANEIDRLLRHNPDARGESREEGRRILIVSPLGVTFHVLIHERRVQVLGVWQFKTH